MTDVSLIPTLHLKDLSQNNPERPGWSLTFGAICAEAAAISLDEQGHPHQVSLQIDGIQPCETELQWNEIDDTMRRFNADREAMELVDRAVLARQRGDAEAVIKLSRVAFAKERAAADLVANELDLEPTRSILHRSAAVLALECAELRDAERLIGRALAGNPPNDIAEELRDLLVEEIYSQRQVIAH